MPPAAVTVADLGMLTELARGGLGTVSTIAADFGRPDEPLVAKLFSDPKLVAHRALYRMVGWRRALPESERRRLDRVAAWPVAVVTRSGAPVGFVMRRVPARFQARLRLPSGGYRPVLREAQYLLSESERLARLGLPGVELHARMEVVWALADTVAFLHERGIVIGDLSARNVLWAAGPGAVMLVDCDSMTLHGVGSPHQAVSTVDWNDPSGDSEATTASDVYKLGLFVLRTLVQSFQSRDPAPADQALDAYGRALVRMSLDSDPSRRPEAGAWERWAVGRRAAIGAESYGS